MRDDEWDAAVRAVDHINRELVRMADHLYAGRDQSYFTCDPSLISGADPAALSDNRFYAVTKAAANFVYGVIQVINDEDTSRSGFTTVVTTAVLAEWVSCVSLAPNLRQGVDYMPVVRAIADGMWKHAHRMLPQSLNIWDSRMRRSVRPLVRVNTVPDRLLDPITRLIGSTAHETIPEKVFNLLEHNPDAGELIVAMSNMNDGDRGYLETLINCLYNANVAVAAHVIEALSCLAKRDVADIALVTVT